MLGSATLSVSWVALTLGAVLLFLLSCSCDELECLNGSMVLPGSLQSAPEGCAWPSTPLLGDQLRFVRLAQAYARSCKDGCSQPKTAQETVHLLRLQAFRQSLMDTGTQ